MAALFFVTVFLSAGLLFVVQPMVGKMLLPLLAASPPSGTPASSSSSRLC